VYKIYLQINKLPTNLQIELAGRIGKFVKRFVDLWVELSL